MKTMDVDSECLRLAEHFLQDEKWAGKIDREDLARVIQVAVEEWLAGNTP